MTEKETRSACHAHRRRARTPSGPRPIDDMLRMIVNSTSPSLRRANKWADAERDYSRWAVRGQRQSAPIEMISIPCS